ncbi:MAG: FAD binding domain-containing protein [Syntrophorhabdales bacterium]|jgi:4-hydroxybenzoyl-CoA reductase subunit beta
MKETSFIAARSVAEACRLLQEHPQSVPMAGGTDLLVLKNFKLISPRPIVYLKSIPGLSTVRPEKEGWVAIGALATLDEIVKHPSIRQGVPLLARAAAGVASPQIRNKATLGGNLCLNSRCWFYNRSPFWRAEFPHCRKASGGDKCYVMPKSRKGCFALQSGDTGGTLVALGAKLRLVSAASERVIDVEDFYLGDGIRYLDLKAGEILTEILLPPPGQAGAFVKFRPQDNMDFATFTLAVVPPVSGAGARIVLGCAASRPLRARGAEEMLDAGAPAEDVARKTAEEARLVSFVRGPVDFKKQVIAAKMADVLAGLKSQPR